MIAARTHARISLTWPAPAPRPRPKAGRRPAEAGGARPGRAPPQRRPIVSRPAGPAPAAPRARAAGGRAPPQCGASPRGACARAALARAGGGRAARPVDRKRKQEALRYGISRDGIPLATALEPPGLPRGARRGTPRAAALPPAGAGGAPEGPPRRGGRAFTAPRARRRSGAARGAPMFEPRSPASAASALARLIRKTVCGGPRRARAAPRAAGEAPGGRPRPFDRAGGAIADTERLPLLLTRGRPPPVYRRSRVPRVCFAARRGPAAPRAAPLQGGVRRYVPRRALNPRPPPRATRNARAARRALLAGGPPPGPRAARSRLGLVI